MNVPAVFDSRDPRCKQPFGAVACGEGVSLTCRPLCREGFTHCSVILCREFAGHQMEVEMPPAGFWEDRACFSITVPSFYEPELVWYWFRFWRDDGTGCFLDKTGYRSAGDPQPWQLTVYQESHTPAWFGEGVTYQIFPDRYCRLSIPDPAGMIGDRWIHGDWEEDPAWRPEGGEIKNRDFFGGSLEGVAAHRPWASRPSTSARSSSPPPTTATTRRTTRRSTPCWGRRRTSGPSAPGPGRRGSG